MDSEGRLEDSGAEMPRSDSEIQESPITQNDSLASIGVTYTNREEWTTRLVFQQRPVYCFLVYSLLGEGSHSITSSIAGVCQMNQWIELDDRLFLDSLAEMHGQKSKLIFNMLNIIKPSDADDNILLSKDFFFYKPITNDTFSDVIEYCTLWKEIYFFTDLVRSDGYNFENYPMHAIPLDTELCICLYFGKFTSYHKLYRVLRALLPPECKVLAIKCDGFTCSVREDSFDVCLEDPHMKEALFLEKCPFRNLTWKATMDVRPYVNDSLATTLQMFPKRAGVNFNLRSFNREDIEVHLRHPRSLNEFLELEEATEIKAAIVFCATQFDRKFDELLMERVDQLFRAHNSLIHFIVAPITSWNSKHVYTGMVVAVLVSGENVQAASVSYPWKDLKCVGSNIFISHIMEVLKDYNIPQTDSICYKLQPFSDYKIPINQIFQKYFPETPIFGVTHSEFDGYTRKNYLRFLLIGFITSNAKMEHSEENI